jgi:hypothetical protein
MPTGNIALVREQGVEFAVVCVSDAVVQNPSQRESAYNAWTMRLRRPVALIGAQHHQVYGHKNIVDFVSSIDPSRLPWRQMHT